LAGEVDYSKFSREELLAEIRREEEALATFKSDLTLAYGRRADLEAALSDERLLELATRTRLRQERIERYEHSLSELEGQISRFVGRISSRDREISDLEAAIARETARLPRISGMERYITTEVIARLRRTLTALQGWQTRDLEYSTFLRDTQAMNRRILASLRGWQIRETAFLERVDELRASLAETISEINRLTAQIATETQRLETKKTYLPVKQLIDAKIIVYSIVRAKPPKKYTKRFQAFYDVDAMRDQTTGEMDYSARLTQKEIDACIDYFYALWDWASLPDQASRPVWIESGEWGEIETPQGADLKQASVREDKEETYDKHFTPPEVVYVPTPSEIAEMKKFVSGKNK
jgi:hypothetical protein